MATECCNRYTLIFALFGVAILLLWVLKPGVNVTESRVQMDDLEPCLNAKQHTPLETKTRKRKTAAQNVQKRDPFEKMLTTKDLLPNKMDQNKWEEDYDTQVFIPTDDLLQAVVPRNHMISDTVSKSRNVTDLRGSIDVVRDPSIQDGSGLAVPAPDGYFDNVVGLRNRQINVMN